MKRICSYLTLFAILPFALGSFANEVKQNSKQDLELSQINLDQVITSTLAHYPKIFSHYDKVRAAESNLLASKGFFDIRLKQNYSDRTRGYYDGKTYDTDIEKHLGVLGSKVYAGYRKSYGKFADYDGKLITNNGGEFRFGAKFSLLKDRDIDQSRLEIILGNLSVEEAKIELENIKMEIVRDATKAYWSWISVGNILKIYQDLYRLSFERQKQLEFRAKKGDVANITAIENRKNLLKRKNSLVKIQQEFEASCVYLSLFLRDSNGNSLRPSRANLPHTNLNLSLEELKKIPTIQEVELAKQEAVERRPEIKVIEIKSQEQSSQLKYAKNLLQPQLNVEAEVSKDLGSGSLARAESNNSVGVNFSLPLQQREAKGKISANESKMRALNYEKSLLQDQIRVEIDQIMAKIVNIAESYDLLAEEVKLAELLQSAEIEKFKQGASNFFLVNVREQDLAASRAALIEVAKEFKSAIADYRLVIFDNLS